jgi:hypothetical protein
VNVHLVPFAVFFFCLPRSSLGVDGNIIHVYREPSLGHLFTEDGIHHHLECHRGVSETKKHHGGFEESLWGKEGGLPLIPWLNSDVIVPPADIEFGEESAATEVVDGLRDQGRNIVVLLCPFIHGLIVLYQAQLFIFLFDEEEVGSIGTPQFADCPPLQVFGHKLVGLCYLILLQW